MRDFRSQAAALRDELIARRRDFHQHPEIAFQELRTAGIVAQALRDLGLEVQTGVGRTGVVAVLEGAEDGPTVMLRSDMDALPIEEANSTPYVSQTAGKMHACGHDGHMAIVLGVAKLLNEQRDSLKGRVKFVFQPAEEIGQGAAAMIADGALKHPAPDIAFGLHIWNDLPIGEIGLTPGPAMAGVGLFRMQVEGLGGHAALPQQTTDPVLAAAHITTALQSIVSRNVSPLESAVISVTQISAGDAQNVIPQTALLQGTYRYFDPAIGDLLERRMVEVAQGLASGMGCRVEVLQMERRSPSLRNDSALMQQLYKAFQQLDPALTYHTDIRTMGAEDMALFLEQVPGAFLFIGGANAARELNYPHHHPRFDFDEEALVIGTALIASAVAEHVLP